MLKRIVLICLIGINTCYAKELKTYKEALDAAYRGKKLSFVIDNGSCTIKNAPSKSDFVSVITHDSYNILKDGSIFLRDTNAGHELIGLPNLGVVTQAYTLKMKSDGSVHLIDHILNPTTYKEVLPTLEMDCQLGKSVKIYSHQIICMRSPVLHCAHPWATYAASPLPMETT